MPIRSVTESWELELQASNPVSPVGATGLRMSGRRVEMAYFWGSGRETFDSR